MTDASRPVYPTNPTFRQALRAMRLRNAVFNPRPPIQRLVLACLEDNCADDDERCKISQVPTIADELQLDIASVTQAFVALEHEGIIRREYHQHPQEPLDLLAVFYLRRIYHPEDDPEAICFSETCRHFADGDAS